MSLTAVRRFVLRAAPSKAAGLFPAAAGLLFFAMESLRWLYLFRFADDRTLTEWLPDDAFYYLVPARNFTILHRWTFDGIAPATGFHLLWGYTIALVYWLDPGISLHQIFALLYFLSSLLLAASLSISCVLVRRVFGPFSVLGPAAVFSTSLAAQLPNFLLESGLVVFFSSLAVYLVFSDEKRPPTNGTMMAAVGIGVLGMLSRSDFGMLPFIMLAVSLAISRRPQTAPTRTAACVLAGSILGLLLVIGHAHLASGHFVQSSAIVKRRWASLDEDYFLSTGDFDYSGFRHSVSTAISPLIEGLDFGRTLAHHPQAKRSVPYLAGGAFLLLALAGAGLSGSIRRPRITIACAMAGVVIGYMTLYSYDGGVQPWYYASYLTPYSVMAASAFAIPGKAWRAVSIIGLAVLLWRASPILRAATPKWPQQVGHYEASLYLRQHPELKPVGAWNAGIESYFSGGGVINLDGLMNDDATPYVLSNSLNAYLVDRHIDRIIDDSIMWESDLTRARGGYAGDVLTRCINSKTTLWQVPNPRYVGDHLLLSTLDPQCLSRPDRQ